jgi:hypothetical protein
MTLRIGIQVVTLAFIGMVFVADCHPFCCLFNNCKCGFDNKCLTILYVSFWSLILHFIEFAYSRKLALSQDHV